MLRDMFISNNTSDPVSSGHNIRRVNTVRGRKPGTQYYAGMNGRKSVTPGCALNHIDRSHGVKNMHPLPRFT